VCAFRNLDTESGLHLGLRPRPLPRDQEQVIDTRSWDQDHYTRHTRLKCSQEMRDRALEITEVEQSFSTRGPLTLDGPIAAQEKYS